MKTLISAVGGATCAAILILACSDDSPPSADAAVCDCPAAEAPLSGRFVVVEGTATAAQGGGGQGTAIATCPAGAVLISGACFVDEPTVNDITLRAFGKEDAAQEAYVCRWINNHPQEQMIHASATCLVPPQ